jgi:hypothetical protein
MGHVDLPHKNQFPLKMNYFDVIYYLSLSNKSAA